MNANTATKTPTEKDFSFPKNEKLKSKVRIEQLFAEGKSLTRFPLKMIYLKHDQQQKAPVQVGFVAPKKNFRKAVQRNRIKRLLREAYRLHRRTVFNNIEGNYALMILYLGNEMPTYGPTEEKLVALLKLFIKKISDEKTA